MMISDFAIKRPIVTVVVMIALVVLGLYALMQLEIDEYPDVQNPIIAVAVPYPGASPDAVEREVVERVEEAISAINGVDKIQSIAMDGFSQTIVFFVFEKPIEEASQDVRDALDRIRGDLPSEIEEPLLSRFDPADMPIMSVTLSSPSMTAPQLTSLADPSITRELRSINGVADVTVIGAAQRELTVELRPADLAQTGVSVAQVVMALQSQNLAAPVGRVTGDIAERTIRLEGRLRTPQEFLNLVIADRDGRIIRLGEVADVKDSAEEQRSLAIYNGRLAIGIDIKKSKGSSTTSVADAVRAKLEVIEKRMPPGVTLSIVQDAGKRVKASVRNVEEMLLEGAMLTVLVVFLFLNSWRSTVITGLALPVSVLAAFIAVWAFGFTLNTMSLLGLSLAIGILIDDAIVVRENIVRHIELGADHFQAAKEGTDEIGLAVAATTFSIVAVFIPVAFMYGIAGQWFKPFALTIAAAVLVSLFVSFSLDPMLSAYWADPQLEAHERRNPIARALDRFNNWFDRQADNYKRLIGWALDHRWSMVGIAAATFFGALFIQGTFGGFGFVPISDNSEINIVIETPPGSNLEYTRIKSEEVASLARRHEEVAYTYTTVGGLIGFTSGSGAVDAANIYVKLTPKADRDISQDEFGAVLRKEVARVAGANIYVFSGGWGGNYKQIQLEVRGPDAGRITEIAERLAAQVRAIPGAVDVGLSARGQKPELNVELNRGMAGSLGITAGQVAQALRPAFAGVDAGDWVDPTGETRDVMVRLARESRAKAADIRQLPLVLPRSGPSGESVVIPLEQVARVENSIGPAQIDHLDREKVVIVGLNAQGRSVGEVSADIQQRIEAMRLPPGYRVTQGGEVADQQEVFGRIFAALGFAVMLMYLILVIQFGSFLDPIAIMLSLPLSLIGVVIALLVTRDTLNIMSLIGVILLFGIVAKNAILLIDFAKWGRERGMDRRTALIEAGRIRLRPILMTTFALIAGMIPVALGLGEGADFRAPLGRAVIGGVITSTLLTLLVIPTVYEILDDWREWAIAKIFRRFIRHRREAEPEGAPAD